jgi:hypothetical protein
MKTANYRTLRLNAVGRENHWYSEKPCRHNSALLRTTTARIRLWRIERADLSQLHV